MYQWTGNEAPPEFDLDFAARYIGKYILVGVTYIDSFGEEVEQRQMHGVIESVDVSGFKIALRGNYNRESWIMPPVLGAIYPAKTGEYRLHTTGEVVVDPDLLSTWSVTKPCEGVSVFLCAGPRRLFHGAARCPIAGKRTGHKPFSACAPCY
jgi:hypothetical protein